MFLAIRFYEIHSLHEFVMIKIGPPLIDLRIVKRHIRQSSVTVHGGDAFHLRNAKLAVTVEDQDVRIWAVRRMDEAKWRVVRFSGGGAGHVTPRGSIESKGRNPNVGFRKADRV